ncbi:MAG: GPR endopeptidase [Lachnospiraceae bacterium]|nr:GPR endopeptidase [Lachnospiraceae bacterium]
MNQFRIRTDLAVEARDYIMDVEEKLSGIRVEETMDGDIITTTVYIESKNASKAMGKPMGTYITIEAGRLEENDEDYHKRVGKIIAQKLNLLVGDRKKEVSILIVGLGNREVTADALGPQVVDKLYITRHIINEYGSAAYGKSPVHKISGVVPGVMAKTGMESEEMVKGIVKETKPDVIIAVDALASRSTKRLNRTIQITDTGIHPGSGVGNNRNALTKESIGVPVIAIGVPTVVAAATIVIDAIEKISKETGADTYYKFVEQNTKTLGELQNMFVTGKDVDAVIERLSDTLSFALNMAFEF